MRLLILTADYSPYSWSGIGVAVERQARALAALGIEVHVLTAAPMERPLEHTGEGPAVHHLSRQRCPVDPRGFDLVHLHSLALSELALQMRWRFGLPLIYTAHSLLHLELAGIPAARGWCEVQAHLLAQSDWVIFLSRSERAAAIERMPGLATRSSVIPNSVAPPPRRLPPPPQDGPVVFAGRFSRNKGLELMAALIPIVLGRYRCRFVLAGGHGDAAGNRAARDVAARFPQQCRVVGWLDRDSLDGLLARSSLVVVPSLYEPFGLIALEAMRVGAPVLAADVGGLSETVIEGSGGRLVPSHDPGEWSDAIVELLSTPSLSRDLRRRGPAYVADKFDPSKLALHLREMVYDQQLCGRS